MNYDDEISNMALKI